jgi:hypothetical protein
MLALNSRYSCLGLPNAGIIDVCYYAPIVTDFVFPNFTEEAETEM